MSRFQLCPHCHYQNTSAALFCRNCGQPLNIRTRATGALPPNAQLWGRYMIVKLLGRGGMAAVYLATDSRLGNAPRAIKEMSEAQLTNPIERQRAIAAFQQEARLLATLTHPNLPKVVDYFSQAGKQYLVMEFVDGQTLEDILTTTPGLPDERQVLGWIAQVCDVLTYLHSQQPPIIFRDLKPGNIMLDRQGRIKLIDFGIARHFKPGQATDTQPMGTPGYAAPKAYGRGQTDARSDVYSLGVTLHTLLTRHDPGLTPFRLPPVRSLNPQVSAHTERVIQRATQVDPARRYQSAAEMKAALSSPAYTTPPPTSPTLPVRRPAAAAIPPPSSGRRRSVPFLAMGGILLCVLALIVGSVLVGGILSLHAVPTTLGSVPTEIPSRVSMPTPMESPTAIGGEVATPPTVPAEKPTPTATPLPSPTLMLTPDPMVEGKIVFMRDDQIWTMDLDGNHQVQLTYEGSNWHPSWSPDGRKIVWQRATPPQSYGFNVWIMDADGGNQRAVTQWDEGSAQRPVWSPDGRFIAVSQETGDTYYLIVMNADGSNATRLTNGRDPTWSPDGRRIAFLSPEGDIGIINADGSGLIHLEPSVEGVPMYSVWSPDGNRLAFAAVVSTGETLCIMDIHSHSVQQLITASSIWGIGWSPDGSKILYGDHISIINADGTHHRQIEADGSQPAWQPAVP